MAELIYITLDQAIEIHRKTVEVSGGGAMGALNLGQLESVLENIQNDLYYPTLEDKLTHLFFSSNKFHCFEDGNKRIALSLGAQFLLLNGYVFVATRFMREMENISYHVAAGRISKELLRTVLGELINEAELSESTQLAIFSALNDAE
ncbi:MAG: type II toxin-antitoxin system death-on-curing family toxin [Epsilonproteobacteria bacterium]|nr:MAG: type II toxin-antitoxin system death-on-curing family toxin [Campylobacterota bacterium]